MSTIVKYPKYLENVDLPLMQPAIAELLDKELQWRQPIAGIISEYACPADQFETQGMITFFEKEIPADRIALIKQQLPEVSAAFDEVPYKSEHLFSGSTPLNNSAVRKLVALASLYFGYKNRLYLNSLSLRVPLSHFQDSGECHDLLGRIPGVTIIQRCNPAQDVRLCHTFVFGHFDWYKKIKPNETLLVQPENVLTFLQSKGFKKNTVPSKGQVVVYHTATTTNHFARVLKVEADGKVIAISKFGPFHVYEHPVEFAQYHYGNSVTFLNQPLNK